MGDDDREEDGHRTPGHLIEALLIRNDWSQRTLAIVLDIDETALNKVITGKRPVTAELALMLEDVFGEPAGRFLDLQKEYDLARARLVARPDPSRTTRAHLFGELPVAAMIKRRWLEAENVRNVPEVEVSLAKFFGVGSVEEIEILPHAAKKTVLAGDPTPAQVAWLYRVRQLASEMIVSSYSPIKLRRALTDLAALRVAPEESRRVPRILSEAGIRYVIVETLPGAKIDGVCFWLDEQSPVIGMSLRHDRIDNFWFVLRHEIEHALREHGRAAITIDADIEENRAATTNQEEHVANEAAADFCVPSAKMQGFVARKSPFFAERDIIGFAVTLGVHPGIVAGQIQHITGRYDLFRKHLAKIRSSIRPSAIVDGWGDVAPVGI
jgi:HTH-type transcriptional regulator/antitoxin HigA